MDELIHEWGLVGLFVSAFISSTWLPGGSEALLLTLALKQTHETWLLWSVATVGNTLGGMTSWLMGLWLVRHFPHHRMTERQQYAVARLQRYGSPLLLLSWVPVVGDPLCVVAGWLRIAPLWSLLYIAVGKGARYAVLLWLAS